MAITSGFVTMPNIIHFDEVRQTHSPALEFSSMKQMRLLLRHNSLEECSIFLKHCNFSKDKCIEEIQPTMGTKILKKGLRNPTGSYIWMSK
jgi:hypothetical protein